MPVYNLTQQPHSVFNEVDRLGLLLGLPRLENERNADYKQRILDIFVNRADSSYRGLINGITRELGLSLFDAMTIVPVLDINGDPVGPNPAVIFQDTKCYVWSDTTDLNAGLDSTFDRWSHDAEYTLEELATAITATGLFTATVATGHETKRSMTIFNQSTVSLVAREEVDKAGARIKLDNENLIEDSIVLSSPNLLDRVETQIQLVKAGQYYIDPKGGLLYTVESPAPGSIIRYKYRDDNYVAKASPVILHNLQSADFKAKMFEQIITSEGTTNGLPTELGADIINELMSVFPSAFGK